MKKTERKELVRRYAKLALDNLRETEGKTATPEMQAIQQQLKMTHEEIVREHEQAAMKQL